MDTIFTILSSIAGFFLTHPELFWGYTAVLTLVTFVTYARDKHKARKNKWRTPEGTLIMLAFIGGAIGALISMLICRHKIRKPKFFLTVPLLALIQLSFILFMYRAHIFSLIF